MISDDLLALISKKELEISKLEKEIRDLKSKYNELNIIKHNYTKDEKIKIFVIYFLKCPIFEIVFLS